MQINNEMFPSLPRERVEEAMLLIASEKMINPQRQALANLYAVIVLAIIVFGVVGLFAIAVLLAR